MVRCTLDKVQKISHLDVVILDMTCTDGESTDKRRELLLKLEDNKVLRHPSISYATASMRCCNAVRN